MEKPRQNFECRTCGQTFGTANELEKHNSSAHRGRAGMIGSADMGMSGGGEMNDDRAPEGRPGGDMTE